jgi:hypothetical protein
MRRLLPLCLLVAIAACGGNSTPPTSPTPPPSPQPTPPAANRAPVIATVTVTPAFGIQNLTVFNFAANATDPDGDPLTFAWNIAGNAATGPNVGPVTFTNGFSGSAAVTVSDGRGGSATSSSNFIVGSMTGRWVGTMPGFSIVYDFTQNPGGILTANFTATGIVPVQGHLDPAVANTINAAGAVTFRSKVTTVGVLDYTITGNMDNTGVRFTGTVSGSGLSGPVVLTKQ